MAVSDSNDIINNQNHVVEAIQENTKNCQEQKKMLKDKPSTLMIQKNTYVS